MFHDRAEALRHVDELPRLKNADAQKEIVAAIIDTRNLELCGKARGVRIEGYDYGVICTNNVALALAKEKQDPSYCTMLDNKLVSVLKCEFDVAFSKALAGQDADVCTTLSQEGVLACTSAYWNTRARDENNVSLCANIPTAASQKECEESYRLSRLGVEPDFVSCGDLSTANLRAGCDELKKVFAEEQAGVGECRALANIWAMPYCEAYMMKTAE